MQIVFCYRYRPDKKNVVDIFKLINKALFPSETLQMCAVRHDGFEILEIWLESLWKGQYTYVQHVQSKSVIKATYNYNKTITVNDVVESLCAVFCACVERIHNGATPPWQLSSLVHLQPFVQLYVVILFILWISALSHMNVFGYVNRVLQFAGDHL